MDGLEELDPGRGRDADRLGSRGGGIGNSGRNRERRPLRVGDRRFDRSSTDAREQHPAGRRAETESLDRESLSAAKHRLDGAPVRTLHAGAGDVLSGLIAGLLAQGMGAWEATLAGAWLHGRAAVEVGPGLIAEELAPAFPQAFVAARRDDSTVTKK